MKNIIAFRVFVIVLSVCGFVKAGPYNEWGVASYIGPDYKPTTPLDENGVLNPIFSGWATGYVFEPTPMPLPTSPRYPRELMYFDPSMALGPSYSNEAYDTVSLGDLDQNDIAAGITPGQITLSFAETIADQNGYDFAVFENGFRVTVNKYFCELGYVEVSSNGIDFARFPSVSLTSVQDPNAYYYLDITALYNLAGKHPNNGGEFTGTPFDLAELVNEPNVLNESVDLNNIYYVRIVDIPGSGDFADNATWQIDPCTWPEWGYYDANHPVYDAWPTYGSDGMDLEAIGILHPQEYSGDINLDGIVDFEDLDIFAQAWLSHFGQDNYLTRCDLAETRDLIVDFSDFAVFSQSWMKTEQWRND
ncbi:MAG: hypothetical protein ABII09_08270 [Planctomycetota bacterium]